MASLEITTTVPCTNMCSYCPQAILMKKYGKKDQHMSMETFITCVSKVPKNIDITFAGYAESFLNPLAVDMIKWAYDNRYKININTTLVGLTHAQLDILKTIPVNCYVLHLPDDLGHMRCDVSDEYVSVVARFVKEVPFKNAHVYGPLHHKLKPIVKAQERTLTTTHLHTRANTLNTKLDIKPTNWKTGKIRCSVQIRENLDLIKINVLLPNGDVTICCMAYNLQHVLGNLLTNTYDELFTGDEYKFLERGLDDDSLDILCRTCNEAVQV